ncbi:MAG: site-specific integrase [Phascolarctobacterium sp.]|nr:site-specific integrase [Candidatus Phascolarctobacterium caballi]
MNKPKIKKRPDGRFERKITLYDGITGEAFSKHVYADTQVELTEKINKLMLKYSGLSRNVYSVGSFIDYYMKARRENDPGTSTLDTYDCLIKNYIAGTNFSRMKMDTVNVPASRQFLLSFKPKAAVDGRRTKQMLYVFLKAVFHQAWKEKVIKENPFDFIDKPKYESKERLTLTKEEFDILLDAIPSQQMKRIFRFARNTGMRRGEICGLQIKDLRLDENYIVVERGIKVYNGQWIVGSLKTKSSIRAIAIPPVMKKLLQEQISFNKEKNKKINPDSFVFQSRTGGFLMPNSLSRAFCDARKVLGFPDEMTFHSLRATVATYLAENDINPKKIQAKLGHSTVAMTLNKYVKHTPEMDKSTLDLLNKL